MSRGAATLLATVAMSSIAQGQQKPVSFWKEIRPLLTAQCAGCHQPSKAGGKVILTSYATILAGGKVVDGQAEPIVVAGKPDESKLLEVLLPRPGANPGDAAKPPRMPKGRAPLSDAQVALLSRWIAEGVHDDTPAAAAEQFTQDHPPLYHQQPVLTALDFSPDGKLLAVSGYHEVLLYEVGAIGSDVAANTAAVKLSARLVGLSERIQSNVFSPDGSELLVVGGSPARFGEVQFWNVAERKLRLSVPVGSDTLYGGCWSPDGQRVAFGGGDNSVRAISADKGEALFFNAASEDIALDTTFSSDGSHLVSVGRDRALKLFEVATQQFVDNITSITPGALKGGLIALDRRPGTDELLIGGADGTPKTYKTFRTQKREIGDDFNLLKSYAPLAGRLFAAEWSADGKNFVVGASNEGRGEVRWYAVDQEPPLWSLPLPAAVYAATIRGAAGGALIAAGGFDGRVLLIDATNGTIVAAFDAAPIAKTAQ